MSGRVKHLYRVTAVWASATTRRDYQTKAAAEHHAEVLRTSTDVFGYTAPTVVTVTVSDPITWPTS